MSEVKDGAQDVTTEHTDEKPQQNELRDSLRHEGVRRTPTKIARRRHKVYVNPAVRSKKEDKDNIFTPHESPQFKGDPVDTVQFRTGVDFAERDESELAAKARVRQQLDEFERMLNGDSEGVRWAEGEGERLFQERQAAKYAERQKMSDAERARSNVAEIQETTKRILRPNTDRFWAAVKKLRYYESLHQEEVEEARRAEGIPDDEAYWPPVNGPERFGRDESPTTISYKPHLRFEEIAGKERRERPEEFSLDLVREGDEDGKSPRLVVNFKEGEITGVSVRGYGKAGEDPRIFPQLYTPEQSSPRKGVAINEFAQALERAVPDTRGHRDRDKKYYWELGVDVTQAVPTLYSKHKADRFDGYTPHEKRGIFDQINKADDPFVAQYFFDTARNKFNSVMGDELINAEQYKELLESMLALIPQEGEAANRGGEDTGSQDVKEFDTAFSKAQQMEAHGFKRSEILSNLTAHESMVYEREGIEGLRRERDELAKLGLERWGELQAHEAYLFEQDKADGVLSEKEVEPGAYESNAQVTVGDDESWEAFLHILSRGAKYPRYRMTLGEAIPDILDVPRIKSNTQGNYGIETTLLYSPGSSLNDVLSRQNGSEYLSHLLAKHVDQSFFVDKEGTIWERKDKDAKTLTKRGNLPNLTPGSFSNSFHYDTALGVSEPERLKEELTKGGKILEIYLAESAKARGVSLPDTTISLTDKKLFP